MFVGKRREGGGGGREDQIGKAMVGHQATIRDVFPCDEPQGCTCPLNSWQLLPLEALDSSIPYSYYPLF
jgi:hypothetical protein